MAASTPAPERLLPASSKTLAGLKMHSALCCRPHVFIAGALQCIAWLAVLISLQRGQHLQHCVLLAVWHLQPIAVALAFVPEVFTGRVSPKDIPLAVALGLGFAFVAAVDWQHAAQHAQPQGPAHLQESLLPAEGMASHPAALLKRQWAKASHSDCKALFTQCPLSTLSLDLCQTDVRLSLGPRKAVLPEAWTRPQAEESGRPPRALLLRASWASAG